MFSFSEVIDMAVQIEKNGEQTYLAALDHIHDAGLKQLLEWIAEEERHHAKWFADLKGTFDILDENETIQEMNETLVRDYLGDQAFSLKEVDFSKVGRINDLIYIFIEFETDSILFYEMLLPFIRDEDTLAQLYKIIAEENGHVYQLRELIESEPSLNERAD